MDNREQHFKVMPRRNILVIEDEKLAAEGLQVELCQRGFDVNVAHNVAEAVELLRSVRYASLIIDVMLPASMPEAIRFVPAPDKHRHGIAICDQLRRGEFESGGTERDVPVFFVTAISEENVTKRMQEMSPERIFTKPIAPAEVAENVKLHLED